MRKIRKNECDQVWRVAGNVEEKPSFCSSAIGQCAADKLVMPWFTMELDMLELIVEMLGHTIVIVEAVSPFGEEGMSDFGSAKNDPVSGCRPAGP